MNADGIDYEGKFTSKNLVDVTWKDNQGNIGNTTLQVSDPEFR